MQKDIIKTAEAPAPIGPYNQAVKANGFLFISGQIPIDPATDQLISGTIEEETEQVMKNLDAILKTAGATFNHAVKTSIFLTDMSLFTAVNGVYGKYFDDTAPARETVAVKGLPKNVHVEISMIAAL